jgi:uncharacterized membrane protein YkgB
MFVNVIISIVFILISVLGFIPPSVHHLHRTLSNQQLTFLLKRDDISDENFAKEVKTLVGGLSDGRIGGKDFEAIINNKTEQLEQRKKYQLMNRQLASVVGSSMIGLGIGTVLNLNNPEGVSQYAPIIGAITLGGTTFYITSLSQDNKIKSIVLNTIGATTISIGHAAKSKLDSFVDDRKKKLTQKKEEVVDYFTSIPTKVKLAVLNTIFAAKASFDEKVNNVKQKVTNLARCQQL